MADHRPIPPSARRRALARAAGLHAASPWLVGAGALAAFAIVVGAVGRNAHAIVRAWLADACRGSFALPSAADVARVVLDLALPALAAAALAAMLVHVAQTRAVWLPRRRVTGAPAVPPARVGRTAFELAGALVVGAVTFGWLWAMAPRLAGLVGTPAAGALLLVAFLASIAIALVGLGVLDALFRHAAHAAALRMTHAEQREDARRAGADPRWRKARADAARTTSPRDAVASASLLLLGDDVALAVAWDPVRRPIPTRTAVGRGARMTQLLGLARHHALPVHRDPELAATLAGNDGPIPEHHWPRLAELVAATGARGMRA
ncbi:MAG: EscU/YscU/HrcU family type III secretion system export apparatus switch protein [Kofleriaceae bacterium]|nr:EscU/YscU/HrcU family type III secretion system export apparatus switch protein [Kofleriaceae bacterium]